MLNVIVIRHILVACWAEVRSSLRLRWCPFGECPLFVNGAKKNSHQLLSELCKQAQRCPSVTSEIFKSDSRATSWWDSVSVYSGIKSRVLSSEVKKKTQQNCDKSHNETESATSRRWEVCHCPDWSRWKGNEGALGLPKTNVVKELRIKAQF